MMRAGALAVVAALALAACSPADEGPRPVTNDEADRIADTFFENYDAGGASFVVRAVMPDGQSITLDGDVDLVGGAGRALVQADGDLAGVDEVAWLGDSVLVNYPDLPDAAAAFGRDAQPWVGRPADPATYELDSLIAVVTALAAPQRENSLLIQQNGVQWLRTDDSTGIEADVFQYGDATRVWLEADGTVMVRFEGNNSDGTRPVVVELADQGPRDIVLPAATEVTPIQDITDILITIE